MIWIDTAANDLYSVLNTDGLCISFAAVIPESYCVSFWHTAAIPAGKYFGVCADPAERLKYILAAPVNYLRQIAITVKAECVYHVSRIFRKIFKQVIVPVAIMKRFSVRRL